MFCVNIRPVCRLFSKILESRKKERKKETQENDERKKNLVDDDGVSCVVGATCRKWVSIWKEKKS